MKKIVCNDFDDFLNIVKITYCHQYYIKISGLNRKINYFMKKKVKI